MRQIQGKLVLLRVTEGSSYRGSTVWYNWKTSFEKKLFFVCVGEYTEYGFGKQRLIWYVFCLWDMVFSWRFERWPFVGADIYDTYVQMYVCLYVRFQSCAYCLFTVFT